MFLNIPTHSHLTIKHFRLSIGLHKIHWVIGLARFDNLVIYNFRLLTSNRWIMRTRCTLLYMSQLWFVFQSEFHSTSPFLRIFRPCIPHFKEVRISNSDSRTILVLLERQSLTSQS